MFMDYTSIIALECFLFHFNTIALVKNILSRWVFKHISIKLSSYGNTLSFSELCKNATGCWHSEAGHWSDSVSDWLTLGKGDDNDWLACKNCVS